MSYSLSSNKWYEINFVVTLLVLRDLYKSPAFKVPGKKRYVTAL